MRIGNSSHREETFKVSNKSRKWKSGGCSCDEYDIEIVELIININKRSIFKGKLPLIYFNCDKILKFATKCYFKEDNDDEEEPKKRSSKENLQKRKISTPKRIMIFLKKKNMIVCCSNCKGPT